MIVGLGNPGAAYRDTRHNIGFLLADRLAESANASFSPWSPWSGERTHISLAGEDVFILKPMTYMNLSGVSVLAASDDLSLSPERLIVLHDDLDLAPGRIKIAVNRGHGGHNGIRSIISSLGHRDFVRLRLGIGRPTGNQAISDYVLAPFSEEDHGAIKEILDDAIKAITVIISCGIQTAMSQTNSLSQK